MSCLQLQWHTSPHFFQFKANGKFTWEDVEEFDVDPHPRFHGLDSCLTLNASISLTFFECLNERLDDGTAFCVPLRRSCVTESSFVGLKGIDPHVRFVSPRHEWRTSAMVQPACVCLNMSETVPASKSTTSLDECNWNQDLCLTAQDLQVSLSLTDLVVFQSLFREVEPEPMASNSDSVELSRAPLYSFLRQSCKLLLVDNLQVILTDDSLGWQTPVLLLNFKDWSSKYVIASSPSQLTEAFQQRHVKRVSPFQALDGSAAIAEASTDNLVSLAQAEVQHTGSSKCVLSMSFFNTVNSAWEPVIESCAVDMHGKAMQRRWMCLDERLPVPSWSATNSRSLLSASVPAWLWWESLVKGHVSWSTADTVLVNITESCLHAALHLDARMQALSLKHDWLADKRAPATAAPSSQLFNTPVEPLSEYILYNMIGMPVSAEPKRVRMRKADGSDRGTWLRACARVRDEDRGHVCESSDIFDLCDRRCVEYSLLHLC